MWKKDTGDTKARHDNSTQRMSTMIDGGEKTVKYFRIRRQNTKIWRCRRNTGCGGGGGGGESGGVSGVGGSGGGDGSDVEGGNGSDGGDEEGGGSSGGSCRGVGCGDGGKRTTSDVHEIAARRT